ncbi:sugar phosphate isomerase/epimerase family protein [Cohnella cellulosilytica]|uniref:Sugar phosphate isomerase/epimerase family protein n=1 Tax=Cohnella cellulosilytica TaxID=986710 RepID=A0ABW2FGS7_9BACL
MAEVTVLNAMASRDFGESLALQRQWGIRSLDLKDHIFGKQVEELTPEESSSAARMIDDHGLRTYCLTTGIFKGNLEQGEAAYGDVQLRAVERVLEAAARLRPKTIRVLAPHLSAPGAGVEQMERQYPWFMGMLRKMVDTLYNEGYKVMIENEPERTVLSSPAEIVRFFRALDRTGKAYFTYDAQNLWQMGVCPTLDVYRRLRPVIGYFHVKGGIMNPATRLLEWKSRLEEASWPVEEMTREVIRDGSSPVICINPSHGADSQRYDDHHDYKRDYDYIVKIVGAMKSRDAAGQ